MSTLPGVPLYRAYGFGSVEETEITLPDGVTLPCVSMDKKIDDEPPAGRRETDPARVAAVRPAPR